MQGVHERLKSPPSAPTPKPTARRDSLGRRAVSAVQRIEDALDLLDGRHELLHYSSVGLEDGPSLGEAPDRNVTHGGEFR